MPLSANPSPIDETNVKKTANTAAPSRLYNGLDTRAMALLSGCALAGFLHTLFPFLLNQKNGDLQQNTSELRTFKILKRVSAAGTFSLLLLLTAMMLAQWSHPLMFQWGIRRGRIISLHIDSSHRNLTQWLLQSPTQRKSTGVYRKNFLRPLSLALPNHSHIGCKCQSYWHWPPCRHGNCAMPFAAATISYFWLEKPLKKRIMSHSN